jgi:uncharacterized coiled-coil protein SlyX
MPDNVIQQDGHVKVNWFTVNVPTIFAVASGIWFFSGSQTRLEARMTAMENNQARVSAELVERNKFVDVQLALIPNLTYRLTNAEADISATNERIDRVSSSLNDLRDGISKINTAVEVLTQKFDLNFPAIPVPGRRTSYPDRRADFVHRPEKGLDTPSGP